VSRLRSQVTVLALGVAVAGGLTACSSSSGEPATGGGTISVVASTNVYGDIATHIAGDKVKVTSIISDPDQDPHSYEADAQTQLELSKADIVIENGGGYDDFVDNMLKTAKNSSVTVLNVVDISGKTAPAGGGDLNEHVWYDFPTVARLIEQLTRTLSAKDEADAATFTSNAKAFTAKLTALEHTENAIKASDGGTGVAITEPVPLYLLQASGLINKTPAEFSKAIESGNDVSPRVLSDTVALFSEKQVKLLAYNEQTSGPETEKILAAAKSNNIAVVPVTETLPAGKDYLTWMADNLSAVRSALAK
jgi:zinc/manganese transport system substrate-binding protein